MDLFSFNDADHSTIELVDKQNRIWNKYYRNLFPIKNSCSDQTKILLEGTVSFKEGGRYFMVWAIILSSLKGAVNIARFVCSIVSMNENWCF